MIVLPLFLTSFSNDNGRLEQVEPAAVEPPGRLETPSQCTSLRRSLLYFSGNFLYFSVSYLDFLGFVAIESLGRLETFPFVFLCEVFVFLCVLFLAQKIFFSSHYKLLWSPHPPKTFFARDHNLWGSMLMRAAEATCQHLIKPKLWPRRPTPTHPNCDQPSSKTVLIMLIRRHRNILVKFCFFCPLIYFLSGFIKPSNHNQASPLEQVNFVSCSIRTKIRCYDIGSETFKPSKFEKAGSRHHI